MSPCSGLLDCHRRPHPRVNQALEEVPALRQWGCLDAASLFSEGTEEQGRVAAFRHRRQTEQVVQRLDATTAEVRDLRECMVLAALVEGHDRGAGGQLQCGRCKAPRWSPAHGEQLTDEFLERGTARLGAGAWSDHGIERD